MTTFVVRIWRSTDPVGDRNDLRGIIENAETGESVRFVSPEELLAFLRAPATPEAHLNPP